MTSDDTMQVVANMMAKSQDRRTARAIRAWNTLRPYECRLVKESAVMGFVLGQRDGWHNTDRNVPADMQIVQDVIEHCDSTSDLYPYLADACAGRRHRITRKRLWPGETR